MNKLVKSDHIEYVHIYLINWLMNALIWNPDFLCYGWDPFIAIRNIKYYIQD